MNLIFGDCLENMREFSNKGIVFDAVISDPPFGIPGEESFEMVREALLLMKNISKTQILILDWRNPLSIAEDWYVVE